MVVAEGAAVQIAPAQQVGARRQGRATGADVRLTDLARFYADVTAVRDVNLSVAPGEFLTLLGPSGSGKTTTLMMLAGFVRPSAGEIFIGGHPIVNLPPERRNIGMVFQNYALFPHMSVFDNVAFPLRMRGVEANAKRQRVQEALDLVQLGQMGERRTQQLSGGQQQRVALARALVFQPPLLLMDEPLGALDRKLREQMQFEIKRIQHALGLTVIYVTHDQEEALALSDRIAIMNDGSIHQVGTPDEIYEHPATTFVAEFVGESNFLDGVVEAVTPAGSSIQSRELGRSILGPTTTVPPGTPVRLMIRPEAIDVGSEAAPSHDNVLAGVVAEMVYLGQTVRYLIQAEGALLTVRSPHRPGTRIFERDEPVQLTWSRASTLILA